MFENAISGLRRSFRRDYFPYVKDRSQEMFEPILVPPQESSNDGQQGQDHQRAQHHPWALMRFAVPVALSMTMSTMAVRVRRRCAPVFAAECHVHQPEHIKGRNE